MEIKHTNPNGEIDLTIKFNPLKKFLLKKYENYAQK